jgi:tetratricopeptide (TPR) repeat protein
MARQPGSVAMMKRMTAVAVVLGAFVAAPAALYVLVGSAERIPAVGQLASNAAAGNAAADVESWPICTAMGALTDGPAWAPLDPDFAAGKRALAANDWNGAIRALGSAALRDSRNADIQNYLGYAHRRMRQLEPAIGHYRLALALNPRHRSAHEHLGEAYLSGGNLPEAEEHLAALERICLIPCDEHDDLKNAISAYRKSAMRQVEPLRRK